MKEQDRMAKGHASYSCITLPGHLSPLIVTLALVVSRCCQSCQTILVVLQHGKVSRKRHMLFSPPGQQRTLSEVELLRLTAWRPGRDRQDSQVQSGAAHLLHMEPACVLLCSGDLGVGCTSH